jgi:uncharacterized protein (TIGR02099 family)
VNTEFSSESSSFSPEPSGEDARRKAGPGTWARFMYGLGRMLLVLWFAGGGLFVVLRVWVLPWVGSHPEWVAAQLSHATGLPVKIDRLETVWPGLRPRLRLGGLAVHDETGREVLRLEEVEATLAWSSLWRRMPDFHWLEIIGPTIELGRGKDGVLSVAGIHLPSGGGHDRETGAGFVRWLLGQHRVAVRDATLIWNDELRGAPPLRLEKARFVFSRGRDRHRFALKARPPAKMATMLDVRGELGEFFDPAMPASAPGRLYVRLERADLGSWQAWVDYPFPCRGQGGVRLWLDSDGTGGIYASADVQLDGVEATLAPGLAPLRLTRLGGSLRLHRAAGQTEVSARELWLVTGHGGKLAPTDFTLRLRQADDGAVNRGEFSASALDLAVLAHLAGRLPIGEDMRAAVAALDLRGHVRGFSFAWQGQAPAPHTWTLKTHFEAVGLAALGAIPGAGGLSGRIEGNERAGRFTIASRDAHLDFPEVFEESRIFFAAFDVNGGWKRQNGRLELLFETVKFANDDAEGTASGRYWRTNGEPGEVDFTAKLVRADGAAVWRYLPKRINERVHEWVQGAVQHGKVAGVSMELRGRLKDFPFREKQGRFFVKADVTEGRLEYAADWPALENIEGELRFEGPGLTIEARGARVFGTRLERIRLGIPDLGTGVMAVEGTANGPSADFLRFIAESPLPARLRDFTAPLLAEGNGQLDLNLVIPLRESEAAKVSVSGDYRFAANRVGFGEGWPMLENAEGSLSFTGDSLRIPSIRARMLGAPVTIEGSTTAAGLSLRAHGQADANSARQAFSWPLLEQLDGFVDWRAEFAFGTDNAWAVMHFGLDGLRSRLPAPFAKERGEKWPLEVVVLSPGGGKPQRFVAKLADWFNVVLERDAAGALRGGVGVNQPARQDGAGIQVAATVDTLDVDAWRRILGEKRDGGEDAALALAGVTLEAGRLHAFGRTFNALKLRALVDAEGWKANVESTEAQGDLIWRKAGDGMLAARFRRLALSGEEERDEDEIPPPKSLPGLDVRVEQFVLGGSELGRLEVRGSNQDGHWRLDKFSVHHPDARFSGNGLWQPGEQERTRLDFTLSTTDIGHLANALGYAKMVRGGQATLAGQLGWQGTPLRIDYGTLSGKLDLNARNGRFEQLEPGVGRLFGVLSLQALPRRATLDFRDVFSEGFIFDRIAGDIAVSDGVMRTDKIEIVGPAARVFMSGHADIAAETQDLRVTVRPTLAESVAVGAAVVNPAAGAVTYLAQKALGDPIEKIFSHAYTITGNWSDPLVEKVVVAPPARQTSVADEGLLQGLP